MTEQLNDYNSILAFDILLPYGLTNPTDSINLNPVVAKPICTGVLSAYKDDKEFSVSTVEHQTKTG